MDKEQLIDTITELVLKELGVSSPQRQPEPGSVVSPKSIRVPVGISNRHIHISREDLDVIYGKGYELTVRNPLNQPGEFAARETVTLVGPRHAIERVRILGPVRRHTQVEISQTDAIVLGLQPPVRVSGDIENTPGITIVGPKGTLVLKQGVIRANRHIHITEEDARRLGFNDRQLVAVRTINTDKPTLFYDVMIRISQKAFFELHIDTDDGNAAGLKTGDEVEVVL
ncbi:phosphate propanoyltransferase [Candidatus Sumerlaeota bacterium]|nr:phosphate propanoyltransferase [Candidatus Sumerlaeota bacterium]